MIPGVIAAVCGECETQISASHKPDFCGTCGAIDGPWVLVTHHVTVGSGGVRAGMRLRLAGAWSAAARAQAVVDLGALLEGC